MPAERWNLAHGHGAFRPIREMEEMRRRFEDEIVRPVMHAVWERIPEEVKGWSPSVDVIEKGDSFEVTPGHEASRCRCIGYRRHIDHQR